MFGAFVRMVRTELSTTSLTLVTDRNTLHSGPIDRRRTNDNTGIALTFGIIPEIVKTVKVGTGDNNGTFVKDDVGDPTIADGRIGTDVKR
jgi:hypothetical protein